MLFAARNYYVMLKIGDYEDRVPMVPEYYSNLKMVSHTAFAALLLLEPTVFLAKDNNTQYPLSEQGTS